MYKAKVSFSGKVSMCEGEIREITDDKIVKDLLKAGYVEELKPANIEVKPTKAINKKVTKSKTK